MTIRLIQGPINSGKSSYLLKAALPHLRSGLAIFILPSDGIASELRTQLLDREGALIGDPFQSWSRFLTTVASPKYPVIRRSESALLILKILQGITLKYFHGSPSHGLATQFSDTISELKKNLIGVRELRHILDTRGSLKENDLLTVYEIYEQELAKLNIHDRGAIPALAMKRIVDRDAKLLDELSFLAIDEFHAIEPGEMELITAIAKAYPKMEIAITFPRPVADDSIYSSYLMRTSDRLCSIADEVIELSAATSAPPKITIIKCSSPIQEGRTCAAKILSAISNNLQTHVVANGPPSLLEDTLRSLGRIANLPIERRMDPRRAPIFAALIAINDEDQIPGMNSIEGFVKIFRERLCTISNLTEIRSQLESDLDHREIAAQELSSTALIDEALAGIELTSSILSLGDISCDSFIKLLSLEIETMLPRMATLSRGLPFEIGARGEPPQNMHDIIILPRAVSGELPRIQAERLFFSDTDTLSPTPDDTIERIFPYADSLFAAEAFIFDSMIAKCRGEIIICHPSIDEHGMELSRSPLLDGFDRSQPSIPVIESNDRAEIDRIIECELSRSSSDPKFANFRGRLTDDRAKKLCAKRFRDHRFSATSLERFAECPFVFFCEKGLGLKALDDVTPEVQSKDRGTIVHEIFERLFSDHMDGFSRAVTIGRIDEDLSGLISRLLDAAIVKYSELISYSANALRSFERKAMERMVRQSVAAELAERIAISSPLNPSVFEWAFGSDDSTLLKVPCADGAPALFHGRVDRVDLTSDGSAFFIVDYKTGSRVESLKSKILKGTSFQLPLYIEAARRFLYPRAHALGGILFDVKKAEKKHGIVLKEYNGIHYNVGKAHSSMKEDDFNEALSISMKAAGECVTQIRSGIFDTDPKNSCPNYCNYADICRYSQASAD